ncbi:glutamyl-tRNA reductase [Parafrigoribacterium soli]|uniref:glutamyl-tRNA reductase n=1 Tax=Parafrigoribacterium soli TaxID=3144663 RepID=UPI0032EFA326
MLLCLTANHENASFELLEQLSIGSAATASALTARDDVAGAVVLATCNRFEAYLDIDGEALVAPDAISLLSSATGVDTDALRGSLTVLTGEPVVEHLFAVSAGLESVIVGEDEISGQVRRSLERARHDGTTSSRLELLFQNASHTSRGVRANTPLGGAGRSLVRLALDLAASRVTDWSTQRVLVVGTGQYAGTTIAALRDRGAEHITVHSPSGRGAAFALRHGLDLAGSLAEAFAEADLVITCTSADTPVIDLATVSGAAPGYRLVIDLGLPRNVDPNVVEFDGIELLDLETVQLHAPLEELTASEDARALVGQAAAEFAALEAEQRMSPAIVALRAHVFGVLETEIARARRRGDADGSTESALRHLAGVLLHSPAERARQLARAGRGQEFVDGLEAVFGIPAEIDVDAPRADARSGDNAATA